MRHKPQDRHRPARMVRIPLPEGDLVDIEAKEADLTLAKQVTVIIRDWLRFRGKWPIKEKSR